MSARPSVMHWTRALTNASAHPIRSSFLLMPRMPGWLFRFVIVVYLIVDRLAGSRRVSTEEIKSVDALDYYALFQIAATFVLAVCLLAHVRTLFQAAIQWLLKPPFIWIALYYFLAILSFLWSDIPLLTLFKAGQCTVFLLGAMLAIVGLPTYRYRVRFLMVASVLYMIFSYYDYFSWTVPQFGFSMGTLHSVVGTVPFIGVLFLVLTDDVHRGAKWYWALTLPLLLAETLFTMYVAVTLGALAYAYVRSPAAGKALLPFATVFVAALALLSFPDDPNAMFLGVKSVGDLTSGTGRFEVWQYVLTTAFWQAPFLGYGFALGDAIPRSSGINPALGQLHNAHLSALLNLGLAGAFLWFSFLGSALLAIMRVSDHRRRAALAGAAAAYGLHQMAGGATLSSMLHPVWISQAFFFFLVALEVYAPSAQVILLEPCNES